MTVTSSAAIRSRFLAYFAERGHTIVPSASLVPDDPSLLFTNAGMVQFKDAFLGLETRSYSRATSAQKCMRVSGKHNDLENVGPSPRHHTFFEMLGNFSLGDYFKREAIEYGWEFMTGVMGVDPERLVLTTHRDDEEAYDAWTRGLGVDGSRVLRMGDKTNFWMMADVGPCGPTSEIHYDFGPEHCTCGRPDCSVALDNDCGRWLEVWNLVFMEYDQGPDGRRRPLPRTGVDTGMGLERMAAIQQGVSSNYDTDLFGPILATVQRRAGHTADERREHEVAYRVLGDHGRAMTFLTADGVLPGNDGRNYVLRLIMRRAMRFGKQMGLDSPFLAELTDACIGTMGDPYPELVARAEWVRAVAEEEEARFERTLEAGTTILDDLLDQMSRSGETVVSGAEVFRLYDTYGFPPDLTRAVAQERGMSIDRPGFERAMDEQRERARAGAGFGAAVQSDYYRRLSLPETAFLAYETTDAQGTVLDITVDGQSRDAAGTSTIVDVVLDRTPFYAEAGGQVGDTGLLSSEDVQVRVLDTRSPVPGVIVHHGVVESGELRKGRTVRAVVDRERRADIMRNHTATHLLHKALQEVLGPHAQQRGSLVAPDRLRFDFAHLKAMTPDEIRDVEDSVNAMVRSDAAVSWRTMPLEDARLEGATMLFGEKYGDLVRVVTVDGLTKELCGGTHLGRTGAIGSFLVRAETSVGSGLRRIEAVTGRGADAFVRQRLAQLDRLSSTLGVTDPDVLVERVEELLARTKDLDRSLDALRADVARSRAAEIASGSVAVDGVPVVARRVEVPTAAVLREHIDALREQVPGAVIVLGAEVDGRPRLAVAVADGLVARGLHAGHLVKDLATELGGGGGGRATMAEAGGRDTTRLDAVLASVEDRVRGVLRGGAAGGPA